MSDERARLDAEHEWLSTRERELRAELEAQGFPNGEISSEQAEQITRTVVDALRQTGNETLAAEWSSAFKDWSARNDHVLELVGRLRQKETDGDMALLDAAREKAADALEHFERVRARAVAWLDQKGGGK
jgi:hypothetical protein